MRFIKLANRNRDVCPKAFDAFYSREIEKKIRERYSVSDELAILRQRDSKPKEFAEYNAYAESCKESVKTKLSMSLEETN